MVPTTLVGRSLIACVLIVASAATALAQGGGGVVSGRVTDSTGVPLAAAINVLGTPIGAYADQDGQYRVTDVPAGSRQLVVHYLGFRTDTVPVTVKAGETVRQLIILHQQQRTLQTVVTTSARLNETVAGALQEQKDADNIVTVMSGDEIAALPNANAAEALARLPGVTAERDEGEGKYVEIRGTPPDFQHVTIDGADVPGTLATDVRAVKLDDVPADILGAIEVSKTLTADQSADAIGGSVNLVTKVPEGPPHGYISGQGLYTALENNTSGQGSLTYGGRVADRKFGFLLSGSYDRTNRVINDVEPSYTAERIDKETGGYMVVPNGSDFTYAFPSEWSQREYNYYRTRYGLAGDLDYRFSPTSSVYLKGLWSAFFDEANRWETDFEANPPGNGQDTVINGVHQVSNFKIKNTVSNRGPIEHTWGFTSGGKKDVGPVHVTVDLNYAGSTANEHNHLEDTYGWNQNNNYGYTTNGSKLTPQYFPFGNASSSSAILSQIATPSQWSLNEIDTDNELNNGQVVGAKADALYKFEIGNLPAAFKWGVKYTNEHKGYLDYEPQYSYTGAATLAQFLGAYSNNSFYSHICAGCYTLAPFGSIPAVQQYFNANGGASNVGLFPGIPGQLLADNLASFAGTEQVGAAYVMQTLDVGQFHFNAGLRAELTTVGYVGHATDSAADTVGSTIVRGNHSYLDFFPSIQVRYALDENTNLRAAFTRGIARPDYIQLAPSLNAVGAEQGVPGSPITIGNPALSPEYSWNTDLLGEHYFPSVGVISGGAFYKQISDFIFQRRGLYDGSLSQYSGYYVEQYQNGPSAELWGVEADYLEHLSFLSGALRGIGFDVNWTHVESRATVPQDTTISYTNNSGDSTYYPYKGHPYRHSPIPRQFPNIFNVALLYDYHPINFRIAGQYTAASIYQYGIDGTSNPTSGDVWNYPHWQIDGELQWAVFKQTVLRVSGTNMNNAVFGFFTGLPGHGHSYNNQREYYGSTYALGLRQGF